MGERLEAERHPPVRGGPGANGAAVRAETVEETEAVAPLSAGQASPPGGSNSGRQPPPGGEDDGAPVFDETAESAYLADARERGETAVEPATAAVIEAEENAGLPLPKLADLVDRIPAGVRETLDELFRARFVTVKRFPKKALKN